jgi:hypothetical protein
MVCRANPGFSVRNSALSPLSLALLLLRRQAQ